TQHARGLRRARHRFRIGIVARCCGSVFWFLCGPRGGCRVVTRDGGAYQAGEARAAAADNSRVAANVHTAAAGQAEAMANLMRRALTRTSAPILSSLSRMVPQVASANTVSARPIRRSAHMS